MWHEARKQEKKIRGMLVDYRKRAERRQDFYEKIKADPTQFMQVHGRKCKIHLDPAISSAGDGAAIIVPWQGDPEILIDRFDVRAHLDFISPVSTLTELEDISVEERQCNYERYRILAQNDFLGLTEDKFLHQLYIEEQFGPCIPSENDRPQNKKKPNVGAAIGYTYDETDTSTPFSHLVSGPPTFQTQLATEDDSDSDIDMDVSVDINKLDTTQANELNGCGRNYGMKSNDFYSFLTKDANEADALRMAREEEQEKIMLSGRKSRRERRAQRERRFAGRPLSPPSYAAKDEQSPHKQINEIDSDSRSVSPENSGEITYITSFGGEDELQPHSKISINLTKLQNQFSSSSMINSPNNKTYAEKVKGNLDKLKYMNTNHKRKSLSPKKPMQYLRKRSFSTSSSRSRSRSKYYRRSRSKGYNYKSRRRNRLKSRSCSRSRSLSRFRSSRRSRGHSSKRTKRSSSYSSTKRRRSYSRSYDRNHKKFNSNFNSSKHRSKYRKRSHSSTSTNSDSNRIDLKKTEVLKKNLTKRRTRSKSSSNDNVKTIKSTLTSNIMESTTKPLSPIKETLEVISTKEPPEVPIKRYYGRKREDYSSSDEDILNDVKEEEQEASNSDQSSTMVKNFIISPVLEPPMSGTLASSTVTTLSTISNTKAVGRSTSPAIKINLRERLKRKMQMLLNKQYNADKKAEIERTERQIQQQLEREDEMRELALKLRRRQRELRHKYGTPTSSPSKYSICSDEEESNISSKKILKDTSKNSSVDNEKIENISNTENTKSESLNKSQSRYPSKTNRNVSKNRVIRKSRSSSNSSKHFVSRRKSKEQNSYHSTDKRDESYRKKSQRNRSREGRSQRSRSRRSKTRRSRSRRSRSRRSRSRGSRSRQSKRHRSKSTQRSQRSRSRRQRYQSQHKSRTSKSYSSSPKHSSHRIQNRDHDNNKTKHKDRESTQDYKNNKDLSKNIDKTITCSEIKTKDNVKANNTKKEISNEFDYRNNIKSNVINKKIVESGIRTQVNNKNGNNYIIESRKLVDY